MFHIHFVTIYKFCVYIFAVTQLRNQWWKSTRTVYTKESRKKGPSGAGANPRATAKVKWILANFTFLDNHIGPGRGVTTVSVSSF